MASASACRSGSLSLYIAQKINRIVLLVSNIIGRVCTALMNKEFLLNIFNQTYR